MSELDEGGIAALVQRHYPFVQAVYLFGSQARGDAWPDSDVDIAVLLPPREAKGAGMLALSPLWSDLDQLLKREVDLINLRQVPTVLQKEVVLGGRRLLCADEYAAEDFETRVITAYAHLNEERAEILREGLASGRFYAV